MENSLAFPMLPVAGQSLHETWSELKEHYLQNPRDAYELAREANKVGEHLLAIEIVECVIETADAANRIPLLQQKALALARSAATDRALQVVEEIRALGGENAETSGLMGRLYKDLAEGTSDKEERQRFYTKSQAFYQTGFEQTQPPSTYCGINAAALAVLIGDFELARSLAERTLAEKPESDPYYALATQAEAMLILKRSAEAADLYRQACAAGRGHWADMVSTRNQCRKLSRALYGRSGEFDRCFPTGTVAIFAGHMIDGPDRASPRFPASAEQSVKERITTWLRNESILVGYSSAASGSDILYLEAAQKLGVQTHIVLPFAVDKFVETSVRRSGEAWVERFRQVISHAPPVTIINDDAADDASSAYDFTNRMIAAKAALQATAMGLPKKALCVWNGLPGDNGGGTADAVTAWSEAKIPACVIYPLSSAEAVRLEPNNVRTTVPFERTQTALPKGSKSAVCAVMHVFFEGYFGLRENQYPAFQQKVLGTLANAIATTDYPPISRYGFGPDYVFVFEMPRAAGMFAIEVLETLAEALRDPQAPTMAMPHICLHAGVVQLMVNPILNQYTHEGTSLTRAGRIVRNVGPGVAYCTEPFAALAALDSVEDFRCEYTGTSRYEGGAQDRLFSVRYRPKPQFKT